MAKSLQKQVKVSSFLYKCTFIKTKHVPLLNRSQQVMCYPYQSMMKGMEEQTSARSSRRKRNKCGPVLSEWLTITRAVSEGKSGASGGRSLKSWAELKGAWAWASQRCGNKVKHGLITVRNRTSFSRGFWCCLIHGAQVLTSKCWLFYLWEDEWLQKWRWSHSYLIREVHRKELNTCV